jgi:CDP-glucose 4,6-dehydratase
MKPSDSFWVDRNVFVTGCTGLLGSWLTEALCHARGNVTGLVRDGVPRSRFTTHGMDHRVNTVRGEVEDFRLLERVLNEYEVQTVFHLAAQTIVGTANRNPLSTFESNIRGTWNILEACRRVPTVRQIIVASSDKAYGEQDRLPYDEESPLQGTHPYDVSKSCADLVASAYFHTYRLPVCITRCGNLFGGGDLNFNRIIPGTIRSVIRGDAPIIRSDGSYVRDYFYVEDAVQAYLFLAEHLAADPTIAGEAFNFSHETRLTVVELVRKILRVMEREDVAPRILNEASNEIPNQYLSSMKARERLGWKPECSLEEGLRKTVAWYRDFLSERDARETVGVSVDF